MEDHHENEETSKRNQAEDEASLPTKPADVPDENKDESADSHHVPGDKASPPPAPLKEIAYPAAVKKDAGGSSDRDKIFAQIEEEKQLALIKAWEDSEKTKAENKAYRRMSTVELWENNKKTSVEAELKKIEEKYEKKKADYAEKMKNKVVEIRKAGKERRAFIEAEKREQFLKVEETAEKFRSTGYTPKKLIMGCFVCQHSAVI